MANFNSISKLEVMDAIREALSKEFESFQQASQQTRQSGNDDETKADGKYDTQSTEANYLADGQARQAQEVVQAAAAFDAIKPRDFDRKDPIDLGALIELNIEMHTQWFFLGPAYGGLEIHLDDRDITVITPDSPLGAQLLGMQAGDCLDSPKVEIVSIH